MWAPKTGKWNQQTAGRQRRNIHGAIIWRPVRPDAGAPKIDAMTVIALLAPAEAPIGRKDLRLS